MSRTIRKTRIWPRHPEEWWNPRRCAGRRMIVGVVPDGKQYWRCRCDYCIDGKLHKHKKHGVDIGSES